MQCPKCKYEPTMAEMQRSPDDCLSCGANYEGHARHAADTAARATAARAENGSAAVSPAVHEAAMRYPGAQPVVVVDISMSFVSMIKFMVKWVIASIPAMAILAVLAGFFYALVSAVPAFFEFKERAEASRAVAPPSAAPERIVISVDSPGEFYALAVSREDAAATITVRSVFPGGDVSYSKVSVDCAKGTAAVVARAGSLDALGVSLMSATQEMIPAGTPRQYVAMHACRGFPAPHPLVR